jgi:1-acyl-sn-glycerol-3-phosphate acyltransferase
MITLLKPILAELMASAIVLFARFITAVRGLWQGTEPSERQRIYYANHSSHGDFVLLWTVLPPRLRKQTRPVAGADYWLQSPFRKFIGCDVFRSVLIDRKAQQAREAPVEQMSSALDSGDSLILFPEGTRNITDQRLLPFKSGLFHLATARPAIDLVPVWIDNLNRVLPKGEVIPLPLICTVTFGSELHLQADESKSDFLARAEAALLALSPEGTSE